MRLNSVSCAVLCAHFAFSMVASAAPWVNGFYTTTSYRAGVSVADDGTVLVQGGIVADRLWRYPSPPVLFDSFGAVKISADGTTVISNGNGQARRWNSSTGSAVITPPPGGFNIKTSGVSGNGSVIVGNDSTTGRAWRWTQQTGAVFISPPSSSLTQALDVSRDGNTVVGSNGANPFIYQVGGSMQVLAPMSGFNTSEFMAISGDGSTFAGLASYGQAGIGTAFRWTSAGGYESLGTLPNLPGMEDQRPRAYAINANGTLIGGSQGSRRAWIWDPTNGIRDLRSTLINDYQLDLRGWTLGFVLGISADGRVITGMGSPPESPTSYHAFVAVIPNGPTLTVFVAGAVLTIRRRR